MRRRKKKDIVAKLIGAYHIKNNVIYVTTSEDFRDDCIIDYAYSFHMCANKELFDRYKPCNASYIVMANGSKNGD